MLGQLRKQVSYFDLVHLHSVFLWPTWAAARAARAAGVPYVLSPRGMLVRELVQRKSRWLKTAWIRLIETRNLEGAAAIHVTSEKEVEELHKFGFRLPGVWTVPNGIDPPLPWSVEETSPDVRAAMAEGGYVLFFGRINWEKGLDRLLASWKDVAGARLIIAGNDEEEYLPELRKIAGEAGVSDFVVFLPRSISGADKEALFAGARLFVLPSYSENFGNTVLEAMIRSLPVVVTEEVGAGEVVREVQGGLVVNGAPASLAKGINELMQAPEKSKAMGESARRQVMAKYSWGAVAVRMAAACENLLQSRKR
jgi:glycosyltransferase involved in cell wall biosynthesis